MSADSRMLMSSANHKLLAFKSPIIEFKNVTIHLRINKFSGRRNLRKCVFFLFVSFSAEMLNEKTGWNRWRNVLIRSVWMWRHKNVKQRFLIYMGCLWNSVVYVFGQLAVCSVCFATNQWRAQNVFLLPRVHVVFIYFLWFSFPQCHRKLFFESPFASPFQGMCRADSKLFYKQLYIYCHWSDKHIHIIANMHNSVILRFLTSII